MSHDQQPPPCKMLQIKNSTLAKNKMKVIQMKTHPKKPSKNPSKKAIQKPIQKAIMVNTFIHQSHEKWININDYGEKINYLRKQGKGCLILQMQMRSNMKLSAPWRKEIPRKRPYYLIHRTCWQRFTTAIFCNFEYNLVEKKERRRN